MRKFTIQLSVALITCLLGITISVISTVCQLPHAKELTSKSAIPEPKSNRNIPKDWKKIDIGDKVSFYLPPNMEKTGLPGNDGVVEAFARSSTAKEKYLSLYYAYGENVPSDNNPSESQRTERVINGKKAEIYVQQYDELEILSNTKLIPGMTLFVADIGDGKNKFEIYSVSFDLNVIKQILDSVEIR